MQRSAQTLQHGMKQDRAEGVTGAGSGTAYGSGSGQCPDEALSVSKLCQKPFVWL